MQAVDYIVAYVILFLSYVAQGLFLYVVLPEKYSLRTCALSYLLFSAVVVLGNMLYEYFLRDTWWWWLCIVIVVVESCGTVLLWKKLSGAKLPQVLLFYLACLVLSAAGSAVGRWLSSVVDAYFAPTGVPESTLNNLGRLLISTCQFALQAAGAKAYRRIFKKKIDDVRWTAFVLILLAEMLGIIIIAFLAFWSRHLSSGRLINLFYIAVCAFADWYLFKTFRDAVKNAELEREMELLSQRDEMQQEAYKNLSEQILQLRRMRHDYVNTLETIGSLLHSGDAADTERFVNDLKASVYQKGAMVFTGNQIVDAVLTNKKQAAEERGIAFSAELLWPAEPMAADADLMSLFANLLDNAIAYCEKLPEGTDREIRVGTQMRGQMMLIDVANTYLSDTPPQESAAGSGTGGAAHGYGLGIVRSIAERSGGMLLPTCRGGMLHMSVLLGGVQDDTPAKSGPENPRNNLKDD